MSEVLKITEKSAKVFNFVKDMNGEASIADIAEGLGRTKQSIGANITDLTKKGLAQRVEKTEGDETVKYVVLTEEGKAYEPVLKTQN